MYQIYYSYSNNKLNYIYLYEYTKTFEKSAVRYAVIDKVFFRFGKPNVNFQKVGEQLFLSKHFPSSENISDLIKIIIEAVFEQDLSEESEVIS